MASLSEFIKGFCTRISDLEAQLVPQTLHEARDERETTKDSIDNIKALNEEMRGEEKTRRNMVYQLHDRGSP